MSEPLPTFEQFERDARADGADEVLVRAWAPNQVVATHSHPFDAEAIVVQGEMWLRSGDETLHLRPGGTFSLPAGTPHDERYGPEGAVYWVARRNVG